MFFRDVRKPYVDTERTFKTQLLHTLTQGWDQTSDSGAVT